jgi:hypothetical protein
MPFVFKRLALFMSIAAAFAADKETPFKAAPAASYEHRQTNSQVTIAAEPYVTDEKQKTAFGKLKLTDWDVLPMLLVIQNDSDQTIGLDRIHVQFVGPNRKTVDATPARDVKYLYGPRRPRVITGPKGPVPMKLKKNPLDVWEVEGRAFSAQMLPAKQSAFGFFYFQSAMHGDASVLVDGLYEAGTRKELLYFEIPVK